MANALTHKSFELVVAQAVVFTPDADVVTRRVARDLIPSLLKERFDGEPLILTEVSGLPPEAPRASLQDKTGSWRAEIAPARTNLWWSFQLEQPRLTIQAVASEATRFFTGFLETLQPRIGRLALVVTRIAPQDKPGDFLADHFCKAQWRKAPFNRPESFEIHAHKKFRIQGLEHDVNSWVRCKCGQQAVGPTSRSIILVEQDLNSLTEEQQARTFNAEAITHFFSTASKEFDTILALYFPSQ